MDPDSDVLLDCPPLIRQYKSGRVERYMGTDFVPAATPDPATGVFSKDVVIHAATNITARLFLPKSISDDDNGASPEKKKKKVPVLVYYHGGGFCIGSAFNASYHGYLNRLAAKAGIIAVSVNYRLSPEHLLPAAYEDSWTALRWVASQAEGNGTEPWLAEHGDFNQVFLAGDSAGANIVHHTALRAGSGDENSGDGGIKISGVVLIHPYFWGNSPVGGETRDPNIRPFMSTLWKVACPATDASLDHPWLNPFAENAPSLAGLRCRKVLVWVAGKDILKERGRVYSEKLRESGWEGVVELVVSEEEEHVFFLLKPECDEALAMLEKVSSFITSVY